MLKNPRFVQLFRPTFLHEALTSPLRQGLARQLPSRRIPPRQHLSTSSLRSSQPPPRSWRNPLSHPTRRRVRHHSRQTTEGARKPQSLSERMKEMSKKYGWTVTGIYLSLSVLDFPFCFLAVRWFGTERIAEVEHTIVDGFWGLLERVVPALRERRVENEANAAAEAVGVAREAGDAVAQDAKLKDPGLGTQLLLAYGVHKSLIFFRIPITLAITPKVVKTLRKWGWQIGKPKAV